MTPLERITERVSRLGHPDAPGTPTPLLSIAEFFEGNTHVGSIGCNLTPIPAPEKVYGVLKAIAARPDVADIRVQITMFDDPEWPFSDTIFIMTTASVAEVTSWFEEELRPDEVGDGFIPNHQYEPYAVPSGYRPVCVWWD